jgi:hypothetical protein
VLAAAVVAVVALAGWKVVALRGKEKPRGAQVVTVVTTRAE